MANPTETQKLNDAELVSLAQRGCADSFEALVRKYQFDLRGFLARRIGDLVLADDLAQEAFLAAVNQISQLSNNRNFRAWLFAVARNKAADYLRKKRRESVNENSEIEGLIAQASLARIQQHSLGNDLQLVSAMNECVDSLKPKAKSLVSQHYFENLSCEKIGQQTRQRSGTIRMALLRIRKSLAKCIRIKVGEEIEL